MSSPPLGWLMIDLDRIESHPLGHLAATRGSTNRYLLNTDLIDQMLSPEICQVCPFLVIGQVSANALGHHYDEGTIVHIKPVRAADERIGAIPYKWTVYVLAQVRFVKPSHGGLVTPFLSA
jgi:hypothetical protein